MATLTEIENRNATTVGTVTSSRMVSGLAQHIIAVVFMCDSHIITDGLWAGTTHRHGCLHVSGAES